MKKIDMTGWVVSEHGVPDSRLTVIKEVEPSRTKGGASVVQYLCRCSCGKEIIVRGKNLRNGNTKSCGCLFTEQLIERNVKQGREIQVGDRFGKLVVIKDLGFRKQKSRDQRWRWSLCQCDCGSPPIEVANNILMNGHKKSCGCLYSVGEYTIEQILIKKGIRYKKQFSFPDLISDKGYPYRFDFAIFNNEEQLQFLIEFDGRQHYDGPEGNWTEGHSLEEIQMADQIKNEYCISHNIILKRIPFFELGIVDYDTILSNRFNII